MFEMGRHPDGSVYIEYETKVPCTRWEFDMDSHTNTLTNQVGALFFVYVASMLKKSFFVNIAKYKSQHGTRLCNAM